MHCLSPNIWHYLSLYSCSPFQFCHWLNICCTVLTSLSVLSLSLLVLSLASDIMFPSVSLFLSLSLPKSSHSGCLCVGSVSFATCLFLSLSAYVRVSLLKYLFMISRSLPAILSFSPVKYIAVNGSIYLNIAENPHYLSLFISDITAVAACGFVLYWS